MSASLGTEELFCSWLIEYYNCHNTASGIMISMAPLTSDPASLGTVQAYVRESFEDGWYGNLLWRTFCPRQLVLVAVVRHHAFRIFIALYSNNRNSPKDVYLIVVDPLPTPSQTADAYDIILTRQAATKDFRTEAVGWSLLANIMPVRSEVRFSSFIVYRYSLK